MLQEVKVCNTYSKTEVFFFKHTFKSAMDHAQTYIDRNKTLFPMELYILSTKPLPFSKWLLFRCIDKEV